MKIWIDDCRPAPEGYVWIKSVNEAIRVIDRYADYLDPDMCSINLIEIIDMDHDAGDYYCYGGDYIKVLEHMELAHSNTSFHIRIHSMNAVGVENMRAIIKRNRWREIK